MAFNFKRRILKVGGSKMVSVPKDLELGKTYIFQVLNEVKE